MRSSDFLQLLDSQVIIGDGAMGTMLATRGLAWDGCFEEANLTRPDWVADVHRAYVEAGSMVVETNSFGANRNRLKAAGLEERVGEVNAAAVRLARSAVPDHVFVAGAVGPHGRHPEAHEEGADDDHDPAFREQIAALLEEGVDLLVLETFAHVEEMAVALKVARDLDSGVPVICQMAFAEALRTTGGSDAVRSLLELERLGASAIGGNCGAGPLGLIRVIEEVGGLTQARLVAQPNASFPRYVNGRTLFVSDPTYFADSADRLVKAGANLVGGCCGTTPDHIRLVAERLKGRAPARRPTHREPVRRRPVRAGSREPRPPSIYSPVERVGTTTVALAEVKPPRGMALGAVRRAAASLKAAGADAFSLVESSLAQVRMSPFALAHILQEEFGVAAVVHCTCRDRNLMGQQAELAGAAALGIRTVLALTGDPASMGDSADSTSVYDTNSLGLIELIANLNRGINVAGNPVSGSADFVIGAALDPNVPRIEPALRRLEKKVQRGARFVMTQPVFDPELVELLYEKTSHLEVPIFMGVMPLVSYRNASFLHNEIPGIRIPDDALTRMRDAPAGGASAEGLLIAKELIDVARARAPGFYLMPQLEKYEAAVELVRHIKQGVAQEAGPRRAE